ncbi:MAG: AAA family ATPase [Chloroflexi bacterium]|nr:AAA family ATPase [Chloroflexota bacterium]
MYICHIRVTNLRNFRYLDVDLGPKLVVVGENNVGKSNLLFALRLILDPTLPDSARHLRQDDFWDGLADPVKALDVIEVCVELTDFKKNQELFSILQQYLVKGASPDTARLTYQFRPKTPVPQDRPIVIDDYEFVIFGGENEANQVGYRERRWLALEVLPALRDAEGDLSSWRRSPLRPLVDRLAVADNTLQVVATALDSATGQLLSEQDVQVLETGIQQRLQKMIGGVVAIDPSLGFASSQPTRLLRGLRLYGDGQSKRPVGDLSLGVTNVLYLLLLAIELEEKQKSSERAVTILGIEEPEAHLHPHLQRLLFRDFLRREAPVILTTHSPHVASVAPLSSILLLRDGGEANGSDGKSVVAAGLNPQEIADLERYLDATRAELLFAKGIIFVEGAAELFLVPAYAEVLGYPLDEYGITVCSVHGTDFVPYAKFAGSQGLSIPFVVVTDGDWTERQGEILSRGLARGIRIAGEANLGDVEALQEAFKQRDWDSLYAQLEKAGVFVGQHTLEVDLLNCGLGHRMYESFEELGASERWLKQFKVLMNADSEVSEDDSEAVLRRIERIGKGRFAQRLAGKVTQEDCPAYLKAAIQQAIGKLGHDTE